MTTNHIDQLAQWYAKAEQITSANLPCAGDALIFPYNAGGYAVEAEEDCWTPGDVVPGEPVRILARAPKPKPAWHNAVAVIAHTDDGHIRQVWERGGDTDYWCGTEGYLVRTEKLRGVTPLIEAKVTDEMVDRVREYKDFTGRRYFASREGARHLLAIALGLETE